LIDKNILVTIENLIDNGEEFQARNTFYKNTYFLSISDNHDRLFYSLFSPPQEFLEEKDSSLRDIQCEDDVKLKAARYIRKEAYKENKLSRYNWLTYPKTIQILLLSLNEQDDKRIIEEIVLALGQIVERYKFPDLRIYKEVSSLFSIESKIIKNAVTTTLSKFNTPDKWKYIIKIGQNNPNKFGQELIVRAVRSDSDSIPSSLKSIVRKLLVNMKRSSTIGRKDFIDAAIDTIDGREDTIASLFITNN